MRRHPEVYSSIFNTLRHYSELPLPAVDIISLWNKINKDFLIETIGAGFSIIKQNFRISDRKALGPQDGLEIPHPLSSGADQFQQKIVQIRFP